MKKFMDFMEMKVAPIFAKLGANPYIVGVKDGMVATVPFTIFGSLFIIIQQFPNDAWLKFIEPYKAMLGVPNTMTMGINAVYVACLLYTSNRKYSCFSYCLLKKIRIAIFKNSIP